MFYKWSGYCFMSISIGFTEANTDTLKTIRESIFILQDNCHYFCKCMLCGAKMWNYLYCDWMKFGSMCWSYSAVEDNALTVCMLCNLKNFRFPSAGRCFWQVTNALGRSVAIGQHTDQFYLYCLCRMVGDMICQTTSYSPSRATLIRTLRNELLIFSASDEKHSKDSDVKLCVQSEASSTTGANFIVIRWSNRMFCNVQL